MTGRSKYFPDVPTMAEQGYPDAQVTPWFGIVVPKATPQPIVERIGKALETALASADVQQKLDLAGCAPKSAPLAEFADIIKADVALWAQGGQGRRHYRGLTVPFAPVGHRRKSAIPGCKVARLTWR